MHLQAFTLPIFMEIYVPHYTLQVPDYVFAEGRSISLVKLINNG